MNIKMAVQNVKARLKRQPAPFDRQALAKSLVMVEPQKCFDIICNTDCLVEELPNLYPDLFRWE